MKIFDDRARTDRTRRRANESQFEFLNRTGSEFFVPVRDVLQRWLDRIPVEHQAGIAGNLRRGDDAQFESSFWELYLHQLITGTRIEATIHPDVPGTRKHPDFLVHTDSPFYLEAVSVGTASSQIAKIRRQQEVEAVLDQARATGWTLSFTVNEVGASPLKAANLRKQLLDWLNLLTERGIADRLYSMGDAALDGDLPTFPYAEDGWELNFTALPTAPGRSGSLVAVRGAGRAFVVDNKSGLRQVLDGKARRYGQNLPHPLVIAALSNTEASTKLYEVQPVLFGTHWLGPAKVVNLADLEDEGHWRTPRGWRRSHNPYVIVGSGINIYSIHRTAPWKWRTLDPSTDVSLELPWAASIDTDLPEPVAPEFSPDLLALGIDSNWCQADPDFEI